MIRALRKYMTESQPEIEPDHVLRGRLFQCIVDGMCRCSCGDQYRHSQQHKSRHREMLFTGQPYTKRCRRFHYSDCKAVSDSDLRFTAILALSFSASCSMVLASALSPAFV